MLYYMEKKQVDFTKNADRLVPAIIQDADSGKVLMLGYMNEEAYSKTIESGLATFWSRSRKTLWTKGETSGNFMHVTDIYTDCDNDTILVLVKPDGPACHRGTESCFDTDPAEGFLGKLERVVKERHDRMPEGHYTTRLFSEGVSKIAQKVGEEAVETILEAARGNKERYIYEASDLLYHLIVLDEQMGIGLRDLEKELLSRHRP